MLRWVAFFAVGVVALVGLVAAIGYVLPTAHHASRMAVYTAAPDAVFAAIRDVARYPEWRSDVRQVEILPDDGRGVRFRELRTSDAILYRVEVTEPSTRVVTRIADPSQAFGGTWTYTLRATAGGTELTITEDGEVYNPIFRFLSRFVFSTYTTIDRYQADLKKRLGEAGA